MHRPIEQTYWALIERFRARILLGPVEKHHVWPRWLAHSDEECVNVTAREHMCLHYLIWKANPSQQAGAAFMGIATGWKKKRQITAAAHLVQEVGRFNMLAARSVQSREDLSEAGKKGMSQMTFEVRQRAGRIGGKIGGKKGGAAHVASGHIYQIASFESCSKGGKKGGGTAASQRWECLVTGKIASAAVLAKWQKARGIDTSLRRRLS